MIEGSLALLTPQERQGLEEAVQAWCTAVDATEASLWVCSGPKQCPCGQPMNLSLKGCEAFIPPGPCKLKGAATPVVGVGSGSSKRVVCLRSSLPSGSICIFQASFPSNQPDSPSAQAVRAYLAVPVLQTARSVLAKAESEDQLAHELHRFVAAQEEEREWVALEMHDRVAQTLASVFQQLQAIEGLARSHQEIRQAAVRASLLCREAIREARNIMNDLRPPILDELGLAPAMEEDLRQLAEDAGCRLEQALSLSRRPARAVELALYRIFRESIVNIRRHAQATRVQVRLQDEGGGIKLEVRDNGVGFGLDEALEKKRIGGLLSMRRRAELVGGAWSIQSQPGQGTKVSVWAPLSPPATRGGAFPGGAGHGA